MINTRAAIRKENLRNLEKHVWFKVYAQRDPFYLIGTVCQVIGLVLMIALVLVNGYRMCQ